MVSTKVFSLLWLLYKFRLERSTGFSSVIRCCPCFSAVHILVRRWVKATFHGTGLPETCKFGAHVFNRFLTLDVSNLFEAFQEVISVLETC